MNNVFVIDNAGKPLMPCHPARARQMVRDGKAKVKRRIPFTIQLKHRTGGTLQPIEFKVDPGSKFTGMVLVSKYKLKGNVVIWAANLAHRGGAIKAALQSRAASRVRRRSSNLRYRAPRFNNRTRPKGWLPPSLQSRVDNIINWLHRLNRWVQITSTHIERVRFDMQAMRTPGIKGIEYQQGTLQGYEVREYLLEKWNRACAYCPAVNVPLQVEHIHPKAKGGTNNISNLAISCQSCNKAKGTLSIQEFLKADPVRLKKILAQAKIPLDHAAAVNATRNALYYGLKALISTDGWSGAQTKANRIAQGYDKDHWIDAACVGKTGAKVFIPNTMEPLIIKAMGRGKHQVKKVNKYGFPVKGEAGRCKRVFGFQTGDLVRLIQPRGKYKGTYVARLASIRASGNFEIKVLGQKIGGNHKNFTLIQRSDGYSYA